MLDENSKICLNHATIRHRSHWRREWHWKDIHMSQYRYDDCKSERWEISLLCSKLKNFGRDSELDKKLQKVSDEGYCATFEQPDNHNRE